MMQTIDAARESIRAINKYYVSAEIAKRVDERLRQRLKR